MKFSELIKKYRKDNNLSQTDLANKLFVTKQAISKWENDRSLPDVNLYPKISELMDITIDELMGNEKKQEIQYNEDNLQKHKYIKHWPIILSFLLVVALIIIIMFLSDSSNNKLERENVKETEKYLNINLPRYSEYDCVEYHKWIGFSDQLPENMYYFTFKNKINFIDDTWSSEINYEIVNNIPEFVSNFFDNCDYYKLINKSNLQINSVPNPYDNIYDRYALYIIDIESNQLIVINFEV